MVWPRWHSNGLQWRGLSRTGAVGPEDAPKIFPEQAIDMADRPWSQTGASLIWDYLGPQTRVPREACDAAAARGEFVDETSSEAGHSTSST